MIRRDTTLPDGSAGWILITQVEHARLSGELAERWQIAPLTDATVRQQLLGAIYHHDDGWADWERNPKVDAELGRPLEFTEMPIDDSLAIWRGSIEAAETIGPLAAYTVAGHFLYLLHRSLAWEDGHAAAKQWSGEFERRQQQWLDKWIGQSGQPKDLADRALRMLQIFDVLSLYICCAERTEPHRIETPTGQSYTVAPSGECSFSIKPWPMSSEILETSVRGRRVPALPYRTGIELAEATQEEIRLNWTFGA